MTKGNDGKAARQRAMKQLVCASSSILVFTVLLLCRRGGSNDYSIRNKPIVSSMDGHDPRRLGRTRQVHHNSRQRPSGSGGEGAPEIFDETGMDPHEVAVRFRRDLLRQAESKDEIRLLEDVLEGKLHLINIMGVEEELVRSSENSYAGVYGRFCRLNFAVHKENPSSGKSNIVNDLER
jgi:hypothetical protein